MDFSQIDPQTLRDLINAGAKIISVVGPAVAEKLIAVFKRRDDKEKVTVAYVGTEDDQLYQASPDVPILVQVSAPAYQQVRAHLAAQKIDAPIIVISHDPDGSFTDKPLDPKKPKQWRALVDAFVKEVQEIRAKYGGKTYHVYVAAPSALTFAMGAKIKDLYPMHIYHYDRAADTYFKVLDVP